MNQRVEAEIVAKRQLLEEICRRHGVTRLELFGSATTPQWEPQESDLDFLVSFRADPEGSIADRFLGLAEDLELLFGRRVELITERAIRNPYFRQAVEESRRAVYAA